jgi:tetratricopeptide (TPR) repeat protein
VAAVPEGLPPATAPGRRLARETTTNSAARDLFDQGITPARFRNNRDARVSLDLFRQAVRLDPSFAGARAHLAMMFVRIAPADHRTMPLLERLDSAKHHALRAVELDDQLPEAHGLLGAVLVRAYEFAGAEASLQRALELDPGYAVARRWLSQLHVFAGRFDEALEEAQRAWESDPASPDGIVEVARGHLVNGDCARTLEWLERLANVRPTLLWSRAIASQCMAHMGRWEEAIVVLREGVSAGESQMLSSLGEVFARAGRRGPAGSREARLEEAWTILDALSAQSARGEATAYDVATVYAGLGENDLALDWLEKAVQDRSLIFEIMHPEYVALHRHPRFVALMSSIRLAGR